MSLWLLLGTSLGAVATGMIILWFWGFGLKGWKRVKPVVRKRNGNSRRTTTRRSEEFGGNRLKSTERINAGDELQVQHDLTKQKPTLTLTLTPSGDRYSKLHWVPLSWSSKYVIPRRNVGRSWKGTIFAVRLEDKKRVSIKCFPVTRKKKLRKLRREIRIHKSLTHPNILKLYDWNFQKKLKKLFVVYEYCSSGSLGRVFQDNISFGFTESVIQGIMRGIAMGFTDLYRKRIIHRNLKLETILLTTDWEVRVAGFDVAVLGDYKTKFTTLIGTPFYMAPEVIVPDGDRWYSHSCDLWSIGVIFYLLLFGSFPFVADTMEKLGKLVTNPSPVQFPKYLHGSRQTNKLKSPSRDAMNLLERLLKKDPSKRISFEEFFDHPFVRVEYDSLVGIRSMKNKLLGQQRSFREEIRKGYCDSVIQIKNI